MPSTVQIGNVAAANAREIQVVWAGPGRERG
jgi:hypothetical protein